MKKKKSLTQSTKNMVLIAIFCAIIIVMQLTGIGLIPLPGIKLTTLHIPVILGSVLLGPKAGAIFGATFGVCSIWANTTNPGLTSYVFSPFMSTTGWVGALKAIWIALGCRILLGVFAGFLWKLIKMIKVEGHSIPDIIVLPIAAALSTLFHTVLVLSQMYLLFSKSLNVAYDQIMELIMVAVAGNGIFEMVTAVIIVTMLGITLRKYINTEDKVN